MYSNVNRPFFTWFFIRINAFLQFSELCEIQKGKVFDTNRRIISSNVVNRQVPVTNPSATPHPDTTNIPIERYITTANVCNYVSKQQVKYLRQEYYETFHIRNTNTRNSDIANQPCAFVMCKL